MITEPADADGSRIPGSASEAAKIKLAERGYPVLAHPLPNNNSNVGLAIVLGSCEARDAVLSR